MLNTSHLGVGYRNRIVINDACLEVKPGELVGVVGPNASGKSTLLKTLAKLLKPLSGTVYIDGKSLAELSARDVAKKIGIVLTERVQSGLLTSFEIVAMGRYQYTDMLARLTPHDRQVIMDALRSTGASSLAERRFSELSDGEKQRIMIARALAQEPSILILDEPTTHLDAKGRIEIMMLLRKLSRMKKIAIIASTHDVELAIRLCDKLVVCSSGKIKVYDVPEQLVEEGGVEELYGFNNGLSFCKDTLAAEPVINDDEDFRIFVIAGGGSGVIIYRLLNRLGYAFTTGVLHEGDIDFIVAKSIGGRVISERPFKEISDDSYTEALRELQKSDLLIYASPPIAKINQRNFELLTAAKELGLPIIQYIRESNIGNYAMGIHFVDSISLLANMLVEYCKGLSKDKDKDILVAKTE